MPTPKAGQIWTSEGISPPYKWKLIEDTGTVWITQVQDTGSNNWRRGASITNDRFSNLVLLEDVPEERKSADRPHKSRLELIND